MSDTLTLEIVTPDGKTYRADAHLVTLPAAGGELGVFPRHTPLLTRIAPGEVVVTTAGGNEVLAVGEGIAAITGDHIGIVTDMAIAAKDVDEAKVEAARQRALARLREKVSNE